MNTVLPYGVLRAPGAVPAPGLARAADWFAEISGGRFRPVAVELGSVELPQPVAWYALRGGLGPAPRNGQRLAADAVGALDAAAREQLAGLASVVVITPAGSGLRPHTWRFRGGGVHLGGGRWVRRYSVLPAEAPLGTVAHELGHLLLDWPDLARRARRDTVPLDDRCLMATGGHGGDGEEPAWPCAPLRVAAGWVTPRPAGRATAVRDLAGGKVARAEVRGQALLVEWRGGEILAFADGPALVKLIPLRRGEEDRPLLAVLAGHRVGGSILTRPGLGAPDSGAGSVARGSA